MPSEDPEMQRRHSSATETSAPNGSADTVLKRQISHENVELIPTRTTKVSTSKPAANPLQFIKVGPCNLYRSAQEQLKKVEEVKKVKKEVRDDAEDWQSNLDNWKCSRRKKQEHIIERVVEVKKLELEEHDRNRRRSKTFSEMMEERSSRGRKLSLPIYQDDDNDLSDLGISSSSKSSTTSTITEEAQNKVDDGVEINVSNNSTNQNINIKQNGTSLNGHSNEETSSNVSNENEEYTYDRAIQNYVNYAETRGKSRSVRSSSLEANYNVKNGLAAYKKPAVPAKTRRGSTPKIEEKLSELEQLKKRSMSTTDLTNGDATRKQIVVPKVDINKRRELFEKATDQEEQGSKLSHRLSNDFSSSKSIRERLSSFGKHAEESPSKRTINRLSGEVSVKNRLSNIENFKSTENLSTTGNIVKATSENVLNAPSVKDRLSSLEKSVNKEVKSSIDISEIMNLKEIDNMNTVETNIKVEIVEEVSVSNLEVEIKNDKLYDLKINADNSIDNYKSCELNEQVERISSPEGEIYENSRQQHYRHRSLDSLDIDSANNLNNDCFGRVQSLEDLDFCRNYPASSLSGDTDREDSGIHTADVSSSVSQADDCDSHLDSSSVDTEFKFQHNPTNIEDIGRKTISDKSNVEDLSVSKIQENQIGVSCNDDSNLEVTVIKSNDISSSTITASSSLSASSFKLPLKLDHDGLPVIPEYPSEPVTPSDILISVVAYDNGNDNSDTSEINSSNVSPNDTYEDINKSYTENPTEINENTFSINISNSGKIDIDLNSDKTNDNSIDNFYDSDLNTNNSANTNLETNNNIVNIDSNNSINSKDNSLSVNKNNNIETPVKLVEDISSFVDISYDNKSDEHMLSGNSDNIVVCMQDGSDDIELNKERRQTVNEIYEKIELADLSTPVDGLNSCKENMVNSSVNNIDNSGSNEIFHKTKSQNANSDLDNINSCLKNDCILNENKEMIYKNQNCQESFMNQINYNLQEQTVANLSEIIRDNKDINFNINSKMDSYNDLFKEKSRKLPSINVNQEIDGEVILSMSPSLLEPPKEKPPPPPPILSDDDDDSAIMPPLKSSSLRRLDSTKRIKKEIRQKRSSFLGIEGSNEDSLEAELEIQPPPDMTSFLQEERRMEQMLYRQSICSESDSNQGESRDSGVELDRIHHDDLSWSNRNHSRQDSEIFGNASTTSEEDELIKKDREIIDIMSQTEKQNYLNSSHDQDNIGEKLRIRLKELEAEKSRLEWEREEELNQRKVEEAERHHQESLIIAKEVELRKQESLICNIEEDRNQQNFSGEMLLSERERLQREQEELTTLRESLLLQQQLATSLQDISQQNITQNDSNLYNSSDADYRRSMPNLQEEPPPRVSRPPPPIPPAKPLVMPREALRNQDKPVKRTNSPQQMTRQTIQALSAAPRSRLISTDTWIQTKKKSKQQDNYNYQHWLIQEAEHRRITELQQRQANVPPKRPAPPHPSAYPGQQYVVNGRETGWQQPNGCSPPKPIQPAQQWISPPAQPLPQGAQWVPGSGVNLRSDKPLPDSIIQTLTQRVQNRINNNPDTIQPTNINNINGTNARRRHELPAIPSQVDPQQRTAVQSQSRLEPPQHILQQAKQQQPIQQQEKMLSVSGKKKCSHCGDELGRGAAMIIETLRLFYHIDCFKCCVCCVQLGDGLMGTDVRVRNNKLHCQNCYSSDDGVKFSCV